MSAFLYFIIVTCGVLVEPATNCNDQWNKYGDCFYSNLAGDVGKNGERLLADAKGRIEQTAVDCFNQNECNNPTPTDSELNTRSECFEKIKKDFRSDLQNCIRKDPKLLDFELPKDPVGGYNWALVTSRIQQALRDAPDPSKFMCTGRKNIRELFNCLQYGEYDYNQTHNQPQRYYCTMKNECNRQNVLDENCQKMWTEQVTPVFCTCSRAINEQKLGAYLDSYQNCNRKKGYTVDGGDPGPALIIMQIRFCEACF